MTTILSFIFVLGILIFVHELGHFLVAKSVGIRVEKFSLGFPPKLISFRYGETEYCISIIPLGGYVKMAGEHPDESEITGAPDEFMSKTPLQRAAVIAAGPVMNVVTAFLIYTVLFWSQGEPRRFEDKVVVGYIQPDSPADLAGLKPDDHILSVNSVSVKTVQDMVEIIRNKAGEEVSLVYNRDGASNTVAIVPALDTIVNVKGEKEGIGRIGIGDKVWWEPVGFFAGITNGAGRTWEMTELVAGFFYKLISGQVSARMVGGPLFIAEFSGEAARQGLAVLFEFIAMLSVNLAIVNVLPIPVLDGGHLVFLAIESVRRKPLSLKQRAVMQQVGLAFLLMIIIFVTYNDITRWITS